MSDSLTETVEISGMRIAANYKTRAFVIQSGEDYIHGRFRENVISRSNVAQIPKDYRFIIEKTMRRNYATDRASTEYVLVKLERTGSRP